MKPTIIFPSILAATLFVAAFTSSVAERLATPNRVSGKYVFIESYPTDEYTELGKVKMLAWSSGDFIATRDGFVKKGKAQFPEADGFIFIFSDSQRDECIAIKFKQ